MIVPCALALKQCLPCNDDPIRNITAEAPDVNVFIGFRDYKWNPPLGFTYFQLSCKAICFSEVSQEEANLCALRNAQACDWDGGEPPVKPPVPPGPNGTGGKGSGPNLPPQNPGNPIQRFRNTAQSCDAMCPDGSPFTETVPAGTVTELSQALADEKAKSLACKLAQRNLFCISGGTPPSACVGESYFFRLSTFNGEDLIWSIDGNLPPGLSFDFFDATITGTPSVGGSYTFVVEVSDSLGRVQAKVLTICIMEIVTAATLPEATQDEVYAQPLIQQPATVSSELWTLVSGSLPPGITLASNGALNGTPTDVGMFEFTLKLDANCNGSAVSCQKTFNLEVVTGVDCMGVVEAIQNAVWTLINVPAQGNLVIAGGDATFDNSTVNPLDPSIYIEATVQICNPSNDPYPFTADFAWTVAGGGIIAGGSNCAIRLNGITTSGPSEFVGSFTFHFDGILLSGVNTLNVVCNGSYIFGPITITGTITIRPLTPP